MKEKLAVQSITKVFENGDGVRDISFNVCEGEFLTLLGPSGCGKTTILRAIGGFNEIDSGKILMDRQEIQHLKPEYRPTSMVFQSYNLWQHMSVYKNLAFGLKIRKLKNKAIKERVESTLEMLHIKDQMHKYPRQLSGGQKQRVAIARSLVLNPSVLLLDEPFSALDAKIRKQMRKEIKKIQKETGITIIFVTHDQEEAMGLSDRIIIMNNGVIEQVGSPAQVYETPSTRFVASFMGEMNFIEEQDILTGFRPEDILLTDQGEYLARIKSLTIAGHYVSVDCNLLHQAITLYVPKSFIEKYKPGDNIRFDITKKSRYAM